MTKEITLKVYTSLQIDKEKRMLVRRKEATMNVLLYDSSGLPPAVQPYADGMNVPAPTHPEYPRQVIHLAKQLRRIACRKFTNQYPGRQWSTFPDYQDLMGQEIRNFSLRVLQKKTNIYDDERWHTLCKRCPRLMFLYDTYAPNRSTRHQITSGRLLVWSYAISDPRVLGEIEEALIGTVRFGIPTQSNFPPKN
jgi:hypothetical protein